MLDFKGKSMELEKNRWKTVKSFSNVHLIGILGIVLVECRELGGGETYIFMDVPLLWGEIGRAIIGG